MAKQYTNDSISALKGAERVRSRPGVIFGSDGLDGCCHAFFEILSNSIDEFKGGNGKKIIVTAYADNSLEVTDFGRGIPVEFNEKEGRYNWDLLFCELYAGGKYKKGEAEVYEYSLGLNGLGLCATQYASAYMDAEIYDGEYKYTLHFKDGEPSKPYDEMLEKTPLKHKSGTSIRWLPDVRVFKDIAIPREYFRDVLKKQAVCNAGLTLLLRWQDRAGKGFEEETYYYENGIYDYLLEIAGDEELLTSVQSWSCERTGRDRADLPDYKVKLNFVCAFSNKVQLLEYYHNSSYLEYGGATDNAVKSAFVFGIENYIKQTGKYTKNESRIKFQDIADCLLLVSNSYSTEASFENQTKKSITNKFIQDAANEFLRHMIEVWFIENKADAEKIANQVLINKRSRENAEKARMNIKKKLTGELDVVNRVEKFVDCRSKDVSARELYIVEGDSALGSCKLARQAEFQAIMPVRGKILNCLKADASQILKSDIIMDLVKIMGCGIELSSKGKQIAEFNIDNLRFAKIIICTDADVDGYHIRTLILAMIYRLMPTLIREGKVYIAESPLYEITTKDKTFFAYTDKEKDKIVGELTGKVNIQRSKGLGENEPEMMSLTTMHPDTRKLLRVLPEDPEKTAKIFEVALGNDLSGRKDYIAELGPKYLDIADIS